LCPGSLNFALRTQKARPGYISRSFVAKNAPRDDM
jgi:hypothetical protein